MRTILPRWPVGSSIMVMRSSGNPLGERVRPAMLPSSKSRENTTLPSAVGPWPSWRSRCRCQLRCPGWCPACRRRRCCHRHRPCHRCHRSILPVPPPEPPLPPVVPPAPPVEPPLPPVDPPVPPVEPPLPPDPPVPPRPPVEPPLPPDPPPLGSSSLQAAGPSIRAASARSSGGAGSDRGGAARVHRDRRCRWPRSSTRKKTSKSARDRTCPKKHVKSGVGAGDLKPNWRLIRSPARRPGRRRTTFQEPWGVNSAG